MISTPAKLSVTKPLSVNQLITLDSIRTKPRTVYQMFKGDVGVVAGLTQMAIRHIVSAFLTTGIVSSVESKVDGRKSVTYTITKEGIEVLQHNALLPVVVVPRTFADIYCIEKVKNNSVSKETLLSLIATTKKANKNKQLKEWLSYVSKRIEDLQELL